MAGDVGQVLAGLVDIVRVQPAPALAQDLDGLLVVLDHQAHVAVRSLYDLIHLLAGAL